MSIKYFPAQHRQRCGECQMMIEIGDQVSYNDGKIVGLDCCAGLGHPDLKGLIPHGKTAKDACKTCFIIHASAQEECYA